MKNASMRRVMMSLCGVIICAIAVGFFKLAAFGVDPFQSLMSGLDQLIQERTGINTRIADDPMTAVAIGTGRFIEFQNQRR